MVSHSVSQPEIHTATSQRSLLALDALNFFLADVVGGVGPYLAVYLQSALRWDAGAIGIAMASASICAVLAQTPAGATVDRMHRPLPHYSIIKNSINRSKKITCPLYAPKCNLHKNARIHSPEASGLSQVMLEPASQTKVKSNQT